MSDISEIISTDRIPAENPMKLHAVVYLQSYIRGILKEIVVENSEIHYISETLVRLLSLPTILVNHKTQLVVALENLLYIDSERKGDGK